MSNAPQRQQTPIAVVGLGALFPGSTDVAGFWRDLLAGRDLIREVPETHWLIDDYYDPDPAAPDKTYARRGAFLDPIDFDALGFGVPPATMPATDTSQLLALIVAQAVLEDAAGGQFETMDRSRISVILGVTSGQDLMSTMVARLQRPVWVKALRESGLPEDEVQAACDRIAAHYVPWQEASFPGLLGNVVAGRIANRLNLGGTNCVTDAACASSLSALAMAVHELELGESDLAIAGGVDTLNDIFMYMCFSKTPALSASGDCRPFSAQADGTMLGEGLGMVALKRLADAERDGDRIYAVLRGLGSSSDGRSKSVYAPVPEGQAKALRRAYALAGYGPDTVELMEAHGTGTKAGDMAEFESLRQVFGRNETKPPWCALGSVKSQIGHTKAAAGAAGLIKTVLALHQQVLPPTIKVEAPNPKLDLPSSPFYLNTRARPWIRGSAHPRRAALSAFGFGGSNFHATLEEYRGPAPRAARFDGGGVQLLALGAGSATELLARARRLADDDAPLGRRARASLRDWQPDAPARLLLLASDLDTLRRRIEAAAQRIEAAPDAGFALPDGSAYGCGSAPGKLALLFPGQGSQYLEMGAALAMRFPAARAAWDRAADVDLDPDLRLHDVVFPAPRFTKDDEAADLARLTATHWAQPAIGCAALALLAVLQDLGLGADLCAGHSFGELVALHAAGAFDADALLRMARRRGELMAKYSDEPGAMAALSLAVDEVGALIAELAPELVVANHNAPKQVVVSGPAAAMGRFEAGLEARRIALRRLPVGNAFHSPLVAGAVAPFAEFLRGVPFSAPTLPVYDNASAAPLGSDPYALRAALAAQIAQPVRFVEMIEAMYAAGARTFVEVGPGSVLAGLAGAILDGRPQQIVALDRKGRDGVEALLAGLARIAAAGHPLRLERLFADEREPPAPRRSGKSALPISGSNYGKVYPPAGGRAALPPPNPPRPAAPVVEAIVSTPSEHPTPAAVAATDPAQTAAWLVAFQQTQQQTASAHAAFQQAMFDSHNAYLRMAESAMQGLGGLLGGAPLPAPTLFAAAPGTAPSATHAPAPPAPALPVATSAPAASLPQPMPAPPALAPSIAVAPAAPAQSVSQTPASPPPARRSQPAPAQAELSRLMLEVVADKTGYPVDMLKLDMDLEGDLGVDSIKRVEILAAVEARAPGLPRVDRARLSALHTLREIVDYLRGEAEDPMEAPSHANVPAPAPGIDLPALMLAVVAEKTGYPVDMLKLDMDLEGDLGVDSIKRVEILAAVEAQAPGLPKVDRARLSALHTLAEIVSYLRGEGGDPMATPAAAPSAAPSAVAAVPAPAASLGRYALELIAAPATGLAQPGLLDGGEVWLLGEAETAAALAAELQSRGVRAQAVEQLPAGARACIHLGGLRAIADAEAAQAIHREVFGAARRLAPSLGHGHGLLVSVQDSGGDFGLSGQAGQRAWLGGLPALIKTAALEWPQASLKAIDIERGEDAPPVLARRLADELLAGGGEIEVALPAAGGRFTLCSRARPLPESGTSQDPIAPGDLVVVSGGARGVTAACLMEWARRRQPRLLLLGRTALIDEPAALAGIEDETGLKRLLLAEAEARGTMPTPAELQSRVIAVLGSREIRATLAALTAAGSEARYAAADVADPDASGLAAVLAAARADWGPIRGLIHAAGVLADKRIAEKTDAQFERVFAAKVGGLQRLLSLTADDPLRLLAVFSSVSARCGNTGQADYAMANEVLSKVMLAEAARRPGVCVKSFGWGPWEAGMVSPALRARFAELGVPMIPLAVGARMFADEVGSDRPEVEIVLGGEPRPQALLADGAEARVSALELSVQRASHGYLEGHAIDGVPVLPAALAAEWMARAARGLRPDQEVVALHELKVLKGIRLRGFDNGGDVLMIEARPLPASAGSQLQMLIRDRKGVSHYSARVELAAQPPAAQGGAPRPALERWNNGAPYPGLLFHRGPFELIESVDGISDAGIGATLRGVSRAGWQDEHWQFDVAAIDGGLQLAVLFGQRMLGAPNLPTAIGELRRYHDGPFEGPIQAIAQGQRLGAHAVSTDIMFSDRSGRRLAELRGVHNHALPRGEGGL
jgi:acyl transferase domain-containing protein